MPPVYIHYGSDKFDKEKFIPIENSPYSNKPYGGLWASREDDEDYGWKTWCENEEFGLDRLGSSFLFRLKDGANVHYISEKSDIEALPHIKSDLFLREIIPDFEECLKQGIDAIEITDIDEVYMDLYGWDCNSILVLNPDVIEAI